MSYLANDFECTRLLLELNVGNALNPARLLDVCAVRAYRQTHQVLHYGELLRVAAEKMSQSDECVMFACTILQLEQVLYIRHQHRTLVITE